MSSLCNGNAESYIIPDVVPESSQLPKCETGVEKEDLASEVFRGFEREPVVLIERCDISPYLNKWRASLSEVENQPAKKRSRQVTLSKFDQECRVNIVKEDLLKLKESLCNRSPRSDISERYADETMAHLKCKICEKLYSSEKKLLNHQQNKHMIIYKPEAKPQKRVSFSDHVIIHEVKEYHKCRKCPRIFEHYKLLKEHMKHQHKKRKCYICDYCSKKFVDRMFFKVHIRLHCDVCGQLLPSKLKHAEHKRNVCRVLKRHPCKTCNDVFFHFMDLKDHSYEHLSSLFICDICKDQITTKCGVAHHIKFLHSKKRPQVHDSTSLYMMRNLGSERLYLCNFCDESSVDRDVIENHIQALPDLSNRAMTGYKDYYFCDQCLKKFSTEKCMLQHKWTHFLKTSDNSQERNKVGPPKVKITKMTYKLGEEIPDYMKPSVTLEKIKVDGKVLEDTIDFINVNSFDINGGNIKKPIVDPRSKKTIISKHQCQTCSKYYSSSYCLARHVATQHSDYETLQCKVCEETFVWPSLLQSHRCILLNHPEMPFDDARPEIFFDNINQIEHNGFGDFNIPEHDDYMNNVDFEIPAPIVTLNECDDTYISRESNPLQNLGYKVIMQEVPIEFLTG